MMSQKKMADFWQSDNKNTLKKTKFDLRIVQTYLCRAREERPLLSIPVGELDDHLSTFIRTHRKPDGSEYEAGTLRGILGSLDRHFEKSGYPHAIYRSKETKFKKTVSAMRERQSYLKTLSRSTPPNQAEPLSERDIERLYATGAIGLHSPTALLHMLFFNIGLHFSLRTLEQHSLRWGDITLKSDPQGRKYLEHTKKLAGGRGASRLHPVHTMRMQIYESPEQPDRDVVKAYQKYAQERPDKMKTKDSPFYLTPQPDRRPGYARWFKNLPVGEARIRGIMKHLKMAAGLKPQQRVLQKSEEAEGVGEAVNGHTVKREDEEAPYEDTSHCSPKIKEEWEEPEQLGAEEKSLIPGRGLVTFHDVAAYFSAKEWGGLEEWQKELYKNVMREIHAALEGMGYKIVNGDVLLKIKEEEKDSGAPEPGHAPGGSSAPDILLRIKHHDDDDDRDPNEEQDTSSPSISGFDPDLSLWALKEDALPAEDGKEEALPAEPDTEVISLAQPSFGSHRESLPGISTLCVVTRPGKRKRRPPQRRNYEQTADSDDDDRAGDDSKRRLPCRNLPPKDQDDWMLQEKLFQCDLCERTFSENASHLETFQSCPQCGGILNPMPDTSSFSQTMHCQDAGANLGFSCRMQGPVG
ncbi:uncharacterized protein LOC120997051 [Bufo bufo]|uniref:uncharacterized protein LOC120997051 n=1 Tax=Bufo bufo TaxID=8384 RepID=UPI001ABE10D3|nr:uncharacterized protein LOC120997051 [Bufo bufo]